MELLIHNNKYQISISSPQNQFYSIYISRYDLLSQYILSRLKEPIFHSISEIPQSTQCSFMAIIDKHSKNRIYSCEDNTVSKNDKIFLEDKTGKIRVSSGLSPLLFITGVVIGVNGIFYNNTFQVTKIYEPLIEEIPSLLLNFDLKIAIVSELHINSHQFDFPTAHKFVKSLDDDNISLLVIIGSTFCSIDSYSDLYDDWNIKKDIIDITPIQMLEYLFEKVNCRKIIIPGSSDPTNSSWPQSPINSHFLKGVNSIDSCTNPAAFEINGIKFLVCSGDAIRDVINETAYTFHESQIMLLRWRLLAPSMPSLIQPHPSMMSDYLVIDEVPHYFVCGDADSFRWSEISGVNVVSIPPFWSTSSAIYIDLHSGEVTSKKFIRDGECTDDENIE
ncbi:DNA polymerase delta subunit 2 [Tritrichomonas musculus]|uniref:DNA polymerase delta subunit 2 n=1 Tax=Tritrichomonas musculus TaxID=1915356 RepID=A0ABR2JZR0_9EUKA